MKKALSCIVFFTAVLSSLATPTVEQEFRPERFSRTDENLRPMQPCDAADWIWIDDGASGGQPQFVRFRRVFRGREAPLRFDVTADARFVLRLDGREIARGPHNGLVNRWYYQTYRVTGLGTAEHVLEATVFVAGRLAPSAVKSTGSGGFLLKAEGAYDADLTTGIAPWQAARLSGTRWTDFGNSGAFGCSAQCEVTGTGFADEQPDVWRPVAVEQPRLQPSDCGSYTIGRVLFPTERLDQLFLPQAPGRFRAGTDDLSPGRLWTADDGASAAVRDFNALLSEKKPLVVPARTKLRVLWDLEDYYSAYPELRVSGGKGACLAWGWMESLWDGVRKGDRNVFAGKSSERAMRDTFRCDGRDDARFTVPWWRSGRWCELVIETADEPLTLRGIGIAETRHPFASRARFDCGDPELAAIQRLCERGLENCLHEIVMDCPFYEQQMYPGDARVQLQVLDRLGDTRTAGLSRFATSVFDFARRENGWVPMQCPSRYEQFGAAWTMCWLMELGDRAEADESAAFLKARIPGLRATLAALENCETADGLLGRTPGWTFFDHVKTWPFGNPPGAQTCSAVFNLFYVQALEAAARVEAACGNGDLALREREKARRIAHLTVDLFWDDRRGLVADDATRRDFSEHAQALAVLSGALDGNRLARVIRGLESDPDLVRASVYFSHYLFEAYFRAGRADLFFNHLDLWRSYVRCGLKTPLESPPKPDGGDARSDCHGWGAHPLYHLHANVAGVRSAARGWRSVVVAPQPGPLRGYRAETPTPRGIVRSELTFGAGDAVRGTVELPAGVRGQFRWKGRSVDLGPGVNKLDVVASESGQAR